jgi:hypothetical protein
MEAPLRHGAPCTYREYDCVARCCAADAAKSLARSGAEVNAESRAKRERCEVSHAATLLAVGKALTAISCAKANANVRLSFFPLRRHDNLRIVAVESAHRLGIASQTY